MSELGQVLWAINAYGWFFAVITLLAVLLGVIGIIWKWWDERKEEKKTQ
jgi:membrane protein DedA with SNARE-associated domain